MGRKVYGCKEEGKEKGCKEKGCKEETRKEKSYKEKSCKEEDRKEKGEKEKEEVSTAFPLAPSVPQYIPRSGKAQTRTNPNSTPWFIQSVRSDISFSLSFFSLRFS
jgi:hypothetical protein